MALPKHLQAGLTPDELTFIAEEDVIDIVPLFSMSRVRLLSGIYGPFTPPGRAQVPLWLALSLKRKRKCRIVAPEWLQVGEYVWEVLSQVERKDSKGLCELLSVSIGTIRFVSLHYFAEKLQVLLRNERDTVEGFQALPRHFIEISKVLLDVASDDLQQPGQLRSLLKDLRELRQAKTRTGMQSEGVMRGTHLDVSVDQALRLLCSADTNRR